MDRATAPILYRHSLHRLITEGVDCAECGRWVKLNRKRLNITMLQYLDILYEHWRLFGDTWVQASRLRVKAKQRDGGISDVQTGDYKTLKAWDLVEIPVDKQGFARISKTGVDFVQGRAMVRAAVVLENLKNRFVMFDGPLISYRDAKQQSFDLDDLNRLEGTMLEEH